MELKENEKKKKTSEGTVNQILNMKQGEKNPTPVQKSREECEPDDGYIVYIERRASPTTKHYSAIHGGQKTFRNRPGFTRRIKICRNRSYSHVK